MPRPCSTILSIRSSIVGMDMLFRAALKSSQLLCTTKSTRVLPCLIPTRRGLYTVSSTLSVFCFSLNKKCPHTYINTEPQTPHGYSAPSMGYHSLPQQPFVVLESDYSYTCSSFSCLDTRFLPFSGQPVDIPLGLASGLLPRIGLRTP